jgi:hypothetical protein
MNGREFSKAMSLAPLLITNRQVSLYCIGRSPDSRKILAPIKMTGAGEQTDRRLAKLASQEPFSL